MGNTHHQFFGESIFQFNARLKTYVKREMLGVDGANPAYWVPIFFDKTTRCFKWITSAENIFTNKIEMAEKLVILIEHIKYIRRENKSEWRAFLDNFPKQSYYQRNIDFFNRFTRENPDEITNLDDAGIESLIRSTLILYHGCYHWRYSNIEGVVYSELERNGQSSEFKCCISAGLIYEDGGEFATEAHIDNEVSFFLKDTSCTLIDHTTTIRNPPPKSGMENISKQFLKALLTSWTSNVDEREVSYIPSSRKHAILVPVFDTYYEFGKNLEGLGSIIGVNILLVDSHMCATKWVDSNYPAFLRSCATISSNLAASASLEALMEPIVPPYDLVRHFLKIIVHLQDWDEAIVYYNNLPAYKYKREGNVDKIKDNWIVDAETPKLDLISSLQTNTITGNCQTGYYMWWTNGSENTLCLWTNEYLSDLTHQEKVDFGDVSIRFKFPKACRIPPPIPIAAEQPGLKSPRQHLHDFYLRQQLDLMRGLIPKVRARRAALRSAVSAIMGRNMSHNLGSHVLARYAGHVSASRVADGRPDIRADFLSYLQRRMDFLAEVATSDQTFWSQPLSLKEQLSRLNAVAQRDLFFGESDGSEKLPVLSFITGKEMEANVEYSSPNDLIFSCPGGEVGVHALYTILENIIRNSARHGRDSRDAVNLQVFAEELKDGSGLLEIKVVDQRTAMDGNGLTSDKNDNGYAKLSSEWEGELERLREESNRFDSRGRRVELKSLPFNINSILRDEPFLDEDGAPNSKYWGLREMQICAQYLRGMALSDLEDYPYSETAPGSARKPLLEAGVHGGCCLKYTFHLQSAKVLAVLVENCRKGVRSDLPQSSGVATFAYEREADLGDLGKRASEYAFLVHSKPKLLEVNAETTRLPVRRLLLCEARMEELRMLLSNSPSPQSLIDWLNRRMAEQYRDKRAEWSGLAIRPFYAREEPCDIPGMWAARMDLDPGGSTIPHEALVQAFKGLEADRALGLVWADHPKAHSLQDIDGVDDGGKGLLFSNGERDCYISWISAEGSFHGTPQHDILQCKYAESIGELIAAATPRVAILDERIQSRISDRAKVRGIFLADAWNKMGVWVPDPTICNLDYPRLDLCKKFLGNPCPERKEQYPIDFLVAHLTVLERLMSRLEGGERSISAALRELTDGTQAEDAEKIVVTGRGVPTIARALYAVPKSDALTTVRYLPLSALLETVVAKPSKLGLMRTLWSAGRPAKI